MEQDGRHMIWMQVIAAFAAGVAVGVMITAVCAVARDDWEE